MWYRSFWFLFLVANAVGASIMWVGSLPSWQGSGISCGLILSASILYGFAGPPRLWLHALAVAGWIAVLGLLNGHLSALVALAVGLGGASVGAYSRRLLDSVAEKKEF